MAFMAQFYPHDAHVKTHRQFIEEQKRRMKTIYRVQQFWRHHLKMRSLQTHIAKRVRSRQVMRKKVA